MKDYIYGGFCIRFPDYILREICTDTLMVADNAHPFSTVDVRMGHICLQSNSILKGMCVGKNEFSKLTYFPETNAYFLEMKNGSNLYITATSITLDINWDNYYEGMIDRYILRHGMILLERLNRLTILHGLAFALKEKAYAIIGPSGYGKSTLALALNKYAGCEILTDDCVVISSDHSSIFNCQNAVYVNHDSADAMDLNVTDLKYCEDDGNKILYSYRIDPNHKYHYPIGCIFFIMGHGNIVLRKCASPFAFSLMCKNIKMSYDMSDPLLRNDIGTIAELVRNYQSYELYFPKDYSVLPTVVDTICSLTES